MKKILNSLKDFLFSDSGVSGSFALPFVAVLVGSFFVIKSICVVYNLFCGHTKSIENSKTLKKETIVNFKIADKQYHYKCLYCGSLFRYFPHENCNNCGGNDFEILK